VSGIRAASRKKRAKHEVFMVVIDYLQLLKGVGRFQNKNAEITEITRALKLLAIEENINVHLLSQLNRENMREKRAPLLYDLRDSGSIEQDADAVAFVWRPEMLHRDEELRGKAELILAKQRNGPTGKIALTWLAGYTKFENRAQDMPE
jgi:replicative DNA helicase